MTIKVLLVDDDKMNGTLLKALLEKKEISCHYMNDAKLVLNHIKETQYDVVLLDIMMPEISGFELLAKIRKEYTLYELPVIMVTAKDEARDIVEALKNGANDYLTKPVNLEVAVARVTTQAQLKHLVKESLVAEQLETVSTLITTLHHEINNPLAIAVGNLSVGQDKMDKEKVQKTLNALTRISDIMKQISVLTQKHQKLQEKKFTEKIKMFDIHSK